VESINAKFLELDVTDPIVPSNETNIPPQPSLTVSLPLPVISMERNIQVENTDTPHDDVGIDAPVTNDELPQPIEPIEVVPLRRSTRQRKPTITNEFVAYLSEDAFDIGDIADPKGYQEAVTCPQSEKWRRAMNEEMKSMSVNDVWELVELPKNCRAIGCKWVFKTKKDVDGNIERFKARLVAKGFTQREGIDFNETFSPVSTKDSFRIHYKKNACLPQLSSHGYGDCG
jgi:hypothetical protein